MVRLYFRARSGRRANGDRSRIERSPPDTDAASKVLLAAECCAVALQAGDRFLGLGQDRRGERGVVGLRENRLSFTESVVEELDYALRSEEHTSELQSLRHLVCRLL